MRQLTRKREELEEKEKGRKRSRDGEQFLLVLGVELRRGGAAGPTAGLRRGEVVLDEEVAAASDTRGRRRTKQAVVGGWRPEATLIGDEEALEAEARGTRAAGGLTPVTRG